MWKKIHWTEYINERAIATLVDVNRKKVMRMSVQGSHYVLPVFTYRLPVRSFN